MTNGGLGGRWKAGWNAVSLLLFLSYISGSSLTCVNKECQSFQVSIFRFPFFQRLDVVFASTSAARSTCGHCHFPHVVFVGAKRQVDWINKWINDTSQWCYWLKGHHNGGREAVCLYTRQWQRTLDWWDLCGGGGGGVGERESSKEEREGIKTQHLQSTWCSIARSMLLFLLSH